MLIVLLMVHSSFTNLAQGGICWIASRRRMLILAWEKVSLIISSWIWSLFLSLFGKDVIGLWTRSAVEGRSTVEGWDVSSSFLDSSYLVFLGSTKSGGGLGDESIGVPSAASLEMESFSRRDGGNKDGKSWIWTSIRSCKLWLIKRPDLSEIIALTLFAFI